MGFQLFDELRIQQQNEVVCLPQKKKSVHEVPIFCCSSNWIKLILINRIGFRSADVAACPILFAI